MSKEKTDLSKILSVSGYSGLYNYLAQSRTGAIAQSLSTGVRVNFPARGKITTLEDISIYTDEGEMKLREVFTALHKTLGEADAPTAKDDQQTIVALFEKAVPGYDRDRFYVSHMKKVVGWYNELKHFASLEFADNEAETADSSAKAAPEAPAAEAAAPAKAKPAAKSQAKSQAATASKPRKSAATVKK